MSEVAGNPVSALILQVVAYHNLTVVQSFVNKENYKEIRKQWLSGNENINRQMPRKLSYAAISDITGILAETAAKTIEALSLIPGLLMTFKEDLIFDSSWPFSSYFIPYLSSSALYFGCI